MAEFCTTQPGGAPVEGCATDCSVAWARVQDDVNRVGRIEDPMRRNRAITQSYKNIAEASPDNHWIRLASYVSAQAGCAMEETRGFAAQTFGRMFVSPGEAYDSLAEANKTIFESVVPANLFVARHGHPAFERCVEAGDIAVPEEIREALVYIDSGRLEQGSDMLAEYEQLEVVQPIYEEYADTFADIETADKVAFWRDYQSIPVSYECGGEGVPLDGSLSIPEDRVEYYKKLMEEMKRIEGIE